MDKYRILVFDDSSAALGKIYIELLLQNFSVEVTCDPKEIVPRAARLVPHIAIVNNDVKNFNGHEVCVMVKDKFCIPIVLLVKRGTTSSMYIDGCKADAVVSKPVNNDELRTVIFNLLKATPY